MSEIKVERRKDYMSHEELINLIKETVVESIKLTVNGKIDDFRLENKKITDDLSKQLEEHMEEIKPFMEAKKGIAVLSEAVKYIFKWVLGTAAIIIAVSQIKEFFGK